MITRAIQALTVLSTVALSAGALGAEPVADFYRGKAVTLVVSSAPGGGYDAVSRTAGECLQPFRNGLLGQLLDLGPRLIRVWVSRLEQLSSLLFDPLQQFRRWARSVSFHRANKSASDS